MMRGKPARKKNFFILGAAVVLCVVGLVMFFLISNLYKNNLCDNIASECPFTIAEDTDWKMYPNNNLAGLIAQVSEHDGQADRMILVLDKTAAKYSSASIIRGAVLYHDYFRISYLKWEDSWHNLEEKNVYETDNYIYLRVQYDNRATLTRIKIGTGVSDSFGSGTGKGVLFDFSDPFEITYYSYDGAVKSMSQEYNGKKSSWSVVTTYEGERLGYD